MARSFSVVIPGLLCALIAGSALVGRSPGRVVHFEDSHVGRKGGELYPGEWTVARFLYSGGWKLREGESVNTLYQEGESVLRYRAPKGAIISVGDVSYDLPPTGELFAETGLAAEGDDGRIVIRCLTGEVILDRIVRR